MRLAKSHNPTVPRRDMGIGLGIRPAYKLVKSLIETSSKVYEFKTYDKAIDNPIYGNRWHETINEKL